MGAEDETALEGVDLPPVATGLASLLASGAILSGGEAGGGPIALVAGAGFAAIGPSPLAYGGHHLYTDGLRAVRASLVTAEAASTADATACDRPETTQSIPGS